jgi:hypothetical protein
VWRKNPAWTSIENSHQIVYVLYRINRAIATFSFASLNLKAMKSFITTLLSIVAFSAFSQSDITYDPGTYKYGVKTKDGIITVPFEYQTLYTGLEGQIIAEKCQEGGKNCLTGIIDYNNNIIVPFQYDEVYADGPLYRVHQGCQQNYFSGCMGGTIGYINSSGTVVVPCIYDNTDAGLWNFGWDDNYRDFETKAQDGYINLSLNGRWGYVNYQGVEQIPFQFDSGSNFMKDSAIVTFGGNEFFINKQGRCIKNCPDNLNFKSKEQLADQSANFNLVVNRMLQFEENERKNYAGIDLARKEDKLYKELLSTMQEIVAYGTPDQQKLTRYFLLKSAIGASEKSDTVAVIFPYLNSVRYIADNLKESDFPLRFTYNNSNKQYSVEAYKTSISTYYQLIAECEYLMKNGRAEADLKKAISLASTNNFNIALNCAYLIDFKQEFKHYDAELLEYSNKYLEYYIKLNEEERNKLNNMKLWTGNQPAAIEAAFTSVSKEKVPNTFYTTGARLYKEFGKPDYALDFMNKAYNGGYDETTFLWEYIELCKQNSNTSKGLEVADKLAIKTPITDCTNLQKLADYYVSFGNMSAAKEIKSKADECVEDQLKAQKKAARQNSGGSRTYSGSGVNGGVYVGVDLFPLLRIDNSKRDYGVKIDFIGKNIGHEFNFKMHNNDRDFMWDLASNDLVDNNDEILWNGYTAAYGLKFYDNEGESMTYFVGPMFRYRSKEYGTVDTLAYDPLNLNDNFYAAFLPKEEQYEVLINYGWQTTKPGFSSEFYFGIGPKYSVFTANPINANFDNVKYYVENPIIEGRKETRWGVGCRVGFTIGIKLF